MKTIRLLSSIALLLCLASFNAKANNQMEELLRIQLNQLIGNSNYTFESLKVETGNKRLSGVGTFFGRSGIAFSLQYDSD